MALPNDVTTCTVTFGPYIDALGNVQFRNMVGHVTPSWPVIDSASGVVVADTPVTVTLDSTGAGSIVLPHTDQAALTPANFTYFIFWVKGRSDATPGNKVFALPTDIGAVADFDFFNPVQTTDGPAVYVPTVASVNSKTGAVTLTAADVGADAAGAAAAAQTAAVAAIPSMATIAADPTLKAAYVPSLPTAGNFAYNSDGTIASDPDGNTYTWNTDGTPATQTKSGVTRTFHWNTDGTLASVS